MSDPSSPWQPIETAPQDRAVDLWAKRWSASTDTFETRRFPNCRHMQPDSLSNRGPYWMDLPDGWRPTHWMDAPAGPDVEAAR